MNNNSKSIFSIKLLYFLFAFLSLGALFGGGALILDPSGELIGMPLFILDNSVFNNFFIPGIILFFVFGIFPAALIYFMINKTNSVLMDFFNIYKDYHWSWSFGIYTAFALIIWISVQIYIIDGVAFIHIFYLFLAIIIILVVLLDNVRRNFLNKK